MNKDTWRQSGHSQGHSLIAKLLLAFVKPAEQMPSRLQELKAIANQGECARRFSEELAGQ